MFCCWTETLVPLHCLQLGVLENVQQSYSDQYTFVRTLLINFLLFLWYCLMSRPACLTSQDVHCERVPTFSGKCGTFFNIFYMLLSKNSFITCMSPLLPDILRNLSSYSILNIHLQGAYSLYGCVCLQRTLWRKLCLKSK